MKANSKAYYAGCKKIAHGKSDEAVVALGDATDRKKRCEDESPASNGLGGP